MLCTIVRKSFTKNKRLFRADAKKRLFKGCLRLQSRRGLFRKVIKFDYLFSLSSSEKILFNKINYLLFYS